MNKDNQSVINTMRDQISEIAKTEDEVSKVEDMLKNAEEQSRRKKIIAARKVQPLKKAITLWRMRLRYGIHWSKPLYPFRLARNIILGKIYNILNIKKYVLRGIEFAITYKCNFNCNHCLCSRIEESATRREMDPKDYARIVKEAMKLGCTTFGLEGGEPFVSPIWEDMIKATFSRLAESLMTYKDLRRFRYPFTVEEGSGRPLYKIKKHPRLILRNGVAKENF